MIRFFYYSQLQKYSVSMFMRRTLRPSILIVPLSHLLFKYHEKIQRQIVSSENPYRCVHVLERYMAKYKNSQLKIKFSLPPTPVPNPSIYAKTTDCKLSLDHQQPLLSPLWKCQIAYIWLLICLIFLIFSSMKRFTRYQEA